MAKANATGRNHQPSKAERQQALAIHNRPPIQTPVATTIQTPAPVADKPEENKSVAKAEPAKIEKKIDPNRGAATRARWAVALKNNPDQKLLMAFDVKAMSHDTRITSVVSGNPKKGHATMRYDLYGFNGKADQSITIGAFLKILGQRHSHALGFADIAWDVNHRFIKLEVPVRNEPPVEVVVETGEGGEQVVVAEGESEAAVAEVQEVVAEDNRPQWEKDGYESELQSQEHAEELAAERAA